MLPPMSGRRGSVLIAVMIAFVVFVIAYVAMAGAQVSHAKRISADYGKLQAVYAAESGVHAAYAKSSPQPTTELWKTGDNRVTYSATFETRDAPRWIKGVGTVTFGGATYTATVRGYESQNQLLMWDFGE